MNDQTRNPHILVVDDHREIRDAVTRYLEKNGMRATAAKDTKEMNAHLKSGRFDLMVLDVMIGGTAPRLLGWAAGSDAERPQR